MPESAEPPITHINQFKVSSFNVLYGFQRHSLRLSEAPEAYPLLLNDYTSPPA